MIYVSIILSFFLIAIAISNGWVWLYLPLGLFILLVITGLDVSKGSPSAPGASPGPQIRPIIIRKKYVGPPSIYPEQMDMMISPRWDHATVWEKSAKGLQRLYAFGEKTLAKQSQG